MATLAIFGCINPRFAVDRFLTIGNVFLNYHPRYYVPVPQ